MSNRLLKLLECLNHSEIEYILVGGMAAVLHGAPVTTQDLDIVHRRTDENIERLLVLLEKLDAKYRGQPTGRILTPTPTALAGNGHNNLMTSLGPLDLLCELMHGVGYNELLPFTTQIQANSFTIPLLARQMEGKGEMAFVLPIG